MKLLIHSFLITLALFATTNPIYAEDASTIQITVQDSQIAKLYVAMLDRDIEELLKTIDASTDQLKALRRSELTGAMAYAYTIPSSKWRKSEVILEQIRSNIAALIDQKSASILSAENESYQSSLLTEPLINAYVLIAQYLPKPEKTALRAFLDGRIEFLFTHPVRMQNEKGMTWCAVMALASRLSGDDKYQQAAHLAFDWLKPLIAESGEYLDPNGIGLRRALSFIRYLFLYRLHTDQNDLDDSIVGCLRWFSRIYNFRGIPLISDNQNNGELNGSGIAQLIGPISYYSRREADFTQIATRYIESLLDSPPGFSLGGGGCTFLLGAAYHKQPEVLPETPYKPYFEIHEQSMLSKYALVGKNYQAAVILQDPGAARGMQSWSYKGQPPVIFPAHPQFTRTIGYGYDSKRLNANDKNQLSSYKVVSVTDGIEVLFVPSDNLTTAYVFSDDMTVVIHKQPFEDAIIELIKDKVHSAIIKRIEEGVLTFTNTDAQLLFPTGIIPNYEEFNQGERLRVHYKNRFCWYTLAGPQSKSIIRSMQSGLIFVHLHEQNLSINLLINPSPEAYTLESEFPGTKIPIPKMAEWSVRIIKQTN